MEVLYRYQQALQKVIKGAFKMQKDRWLTPEVLRGLGKLYLNNQTTMLPKEGK